jgi:hypothetical protein
VYHAATSDLDGSTASLDTEGLSADQEEAKSMQIVVNVLEPSFDERQYPGPQGLGLRVIFTENLELVSIDGSPQPAQTPGGTHSGIVTTLRNASATDILFPNNELWHYEATYVFDAVSANLPAALQKGQITVHGVFWAVPGQPASGTRTFAITGGTGAYALARGQVTESGLRLRVRTLDITL